MTSEANQLKPVAWLDAFGKPHKNYRDALVDFDPEHQPQPLYLAPADGAPPSNETRQKLIEDAITKATGAHRVLNAYDYEDVFACCEAVLAAAGVAPSDGGQAK